MNRVIHWHAPPVWLTGSLLLCLVLSGDSTGATSDPLWQRAAGAADLRIQQLEQAVAGGDAARIQASVLELQADPLAVNRLNKTGSDSLKQACNRVIDDVRGRTMKQVQDVISKKYGVDAADVEVKSITNPTKAGEIKVGQDWDVTVKVRGKDIPTRVSTPTLQQAFYESATGKSAEGFSGKAEFHEAAERFAHQQCVEVTNYQVSEAYGGAPSEGELIIQGDKGARLRDPGQLSKVIAYKSDIAAERALAMESQGRVVEAQAWRLEQCRQAVKQFDRQVLPRVEEMGGKVPQDIKDAMDVLREVEKGNLSPVEAEASLQRMKTSVQRLTHDAADLVEAAHDLRAPGARAPLPADPIAENVRNRIELDRLLKGAGDAEGVGGPKLKASGEDLDKIARGKPAVGEGSGPSEGITGKGVGILFALLALKDSFNVGTEAGGAIDRYANAKDEKESQKALDDLKGSAKEGTLLFTLTFLAERHPAIGAAILFSHGVGYYDVVGDKMGDFWDDIGGVFGFETRFDVQRLAQMERVDAYKRALDAGELKMKGGMTQEAFLLFVRTMEPTDPDFRTLKELMIERPASESSILDQLRPYNLADLTAEQRLKLIEQLKAAGLWPLPKDPTKPQPEAGPEVGEAVAAARAAFSSLEDACRPIIEVTNNPALPRAASACQRFGDLYKQFQERVGPVETETETAVDLISSAGRFPEAEKPLRDALRAVLRAADAFRQARKTHDEIMGLYSVCEEVRKETDRCARLARECGGHEQNFHQVCTAQLQRLGPGDSGAASDSPAAAAATEIRLLGLRVAELRGQITDAMSKLYETLQPCEVIEPPIADVVRLTEERMSEADAGFSAVQFVLSSRLAARAKELEEAKQLLDKRGTQREDRTKRVAYLKEHVAKRQKAIAAPGTAVAERQKLQGEMTEIRSDLDQNQKVITAIDQDIEKRKEDVKQLEPTIKLLGEVSGAMPASN